MGKERKKNANGWVGALLEGQKGRVGGGGTKEKWPHTGDEKSFG